MAKYILSDIFKGDFPVTQYYGQRPEYYAQFGLAGHEGIDFGTPDGTPILAPFDGVILRDTFDDKDYGNFTVVWDKVQLCAVWFCHLKDVTTKVGDSVKQGQIIGHTNNTGNTSGPHLHFNFVETDAGGNRLNKDNGYQGFLNALDPALVEWKLGGQQQSIPIPDVLPPNYSDIVHGSTQWDKTVHKYVGDSADPTKTDFEAVQSVVGGIQSVGTTCQNNLKEVNTQLAAATQTITNDEEKLALEEQQRQDDAKSFQAQIDALKATQPNSDKLIATYTSQIEALQGQVKQLLNDKHDLSVKLAQALAGPIIYTPFGNLLISLANLFKKTS